MARADHVISGVASPQLRHFAEFAAVRARIGRGLHALERRQLLDRSGQKRRRGIVLDHRHGSFRQGPARGRRGSYRTVNWPQVAGHITTYSSKTGKVESIPVGRFDFVASQPWSISNYRLIAANWLSTNILSYAFLLVVLSLLIGVATAAMLSRLGRRE